LGQLFFSLEKKRELRVNLMIPPAAAQGSIKKKRQKNGCNYLGLDWQERFLPPPAAAAVRLLQLKHFVDCF
jgi:hypothetical protein